jgi:3-deoxy-7-phosphoheptulonate synthase
MIVVMRSGAPKAQVDAVLKRIEADGQPVHVFHGEERIVIAVLGEEPSEELREGLETLPGVEEVERTTKPYKLASREVHADSSRVRVGSATFGSGFVLGAGCGRVYPSAELVSVALSAQGAGADVFWLGRTAGAELGRVLPLVADLRRQSRLPLLVEIWGPDEFDPLELYCDGFIVGPQHLHSYPLIRLAGRSRRPIVLCRGASTSVEEWLLVAEEVLKGGNFDVVLCEQGIRTYETSVRSTLDFSALPIVKRLSHLPVIANPSLASGRREVVSALALGAAGAGADGVLIDVHPGSEDAPGAAAQAIGLAEFRSLAQRIGPLSAAVEQTRA